MVISTDASLTLNSQKALKLLPVSIEFSRPIVILFFTVKGCAGIVLYSVTVM